MNCLWLLFCNERREQFAHGWSLFLKKSDWAKSNASNSLLGTKKGKSSELLVFESDSKIMSESLMSLFFTEPQKGFAHGQSFVMSNLSELLTVALLLRATRVINSQSFYFKERIEQIAHSCSIIWTILSKRVKREKANSQPQPQPLASATIAYNGLIYIKLWSYVCKLKWVDLL